MRRFLKYACITVAVAAAIPVLLGGLALCFRYYALHLAPLHMQSPMESPNGKYAASVGFRGFMDEYSDRTLLLQEGNGPRKAVWKDMNAVGKPEWSPDSRFVAVGYVGQGREIREFTEGRPRREVPRAYYRFSVYDVQTGRHIEEHGQCDMDIPPEAEYIPVTWKWQTPKTIVIAQNDELTVAELTISDTGPGLKIGERQLVKLKGVKPYTQHLTAHYTPPKIGKPIRSPDGKYAALIFYKERGPFRVARIYLQEGNGRKKKIWEQRTNMYFLMAWSPDSRRIAFLNPGRGWHGRRAPYSGTVSYVAWSLFVYDVHTQHKGLGHDSIDVDLPQDVVDDEITWKWLDPDRLQISIEYAETHDKMVTKPIALFAIEDTGSELKITELVLMKLKNARP